MLQGNPSFVKGFAENDGWNLLFFQMTDVIYTAYTSARDEVKGGVLADDVVIQVRCGALHHSVTADVCAENLGYTFLYICINERFQLVIALFFPSVDGYLSVFDIGSQNNLLGAVLGKPFVENVPGV